MKAILDKLQNENLTDYRAIPFWSWNSELDPEELRRQVRWMKEVGLGGFFMHARSGLKTEYMSEDWMKCIEACADEAQKIGMNAWAYDENGWPSGFAGGKLLEDPEDRDQYLLHKIGKLDKKATVSYRMEEKKLVRVMDAEQEKNADFHGKYLNVYVRIATSTADILNPEVMDKFIALTHEKYAEHFGDNFSTALKGFFTDEPQYQRWHTPYTKMIAKYFAEEYGEDILDHIGLLFVEKEGYRSFRYRYWCGMQKLMLKNFAEKIYGWCDAHGVKLTGHYVEETSLGFQLMCCAGAMPFYEFEHIPGIDWLGNNSDNELSPKQLGSACAQLGKKQIMTETFAGCGWDATPGELRRIAGFQYVNGVNLMCQHLVPYEEYGGRKHDWPTHFSPVNPWIREDFKDFNDYFTHLGYLLAEGEEQVNVAMLHPIRSAYFDYKREQETKGFGVGRLDKQLKKACRTLSSRNIAYHFLDETLLEKYGFVEDASIGCGKCSYDYLVIPSMITMGKATEKLLKKYVENGGKVLILGDKPTYLEGEEYDYSYLCGNCTVRDLVAAQPYRVKNTKTMIYSTRRTMDGETYLYAINASKTETFTQTFSMGKKIKSFRALDLVTFQTKQMGLTITLKPGEAVLLFADEAPLQEENVLDTYHLRFRNANVSYNENYLPIDYVRYSTDGVNYSDKWPCMALFQKLLETRMEGRIFFKYEFDVRKVPAEIVLRGEKCANMKVFMNGHPLTETIPCNIEKNVLAFNIAPYVREGCNEYVVETTWHQNEDVYYALFGEDVTESLQNCIVYDSELEPVYIAGQFGVYPVDPYVPHMTNGFVEAKEFYIGESPCTVSDTVLDGLPFLSGAVTLTQKVVLENKNVLLHVDGRFLTATVTVNGHNAGKLLFDRDLDISQYAVEGENEISVRFLRGNYNLLGPQHVNAPKDGISPKGYFELLDTWQDGKSPMYLDVYGLSTLYR